MDEGFDDDQVVFPPHDMAGNLTGDGVFTYVYDAWNRLVEVRRVGEDEIPVAAIAYDGLGRRIRKEIKNSGDWSAGYDGQGQPNTMPYHYYHDGQRTIETRDDGWHGHAVLRDHAGMSHGHAETGVAMPPLEHVWGLTYVPARPPECPGMVGGDELVQIGVNQDPQNASGGTYTENLCERFFWACQDANFNVLGLASATGLLVERYEYTPYGQRTVFTHDWLLADMNGDGVINGADYCTWADAYGQRHADKDPRVTYPALDSARGVKSGDAVLAFSTCDVGHQGLFFDKEFGLYYNRARYLEPVFGRLLQRDPAGYADGPNSHPYARHGPHGLIDSAWLPSVGACTATMMKPQYPRFTQARDKNALHIPGAGSHIEDEYIPADPAGAKQYADGMSLYQYAGSHPINVLDPDGLRVVWLGEDDYACDPGDRVAFLPMDGKPVLVQTTTDRINPDEMDKLLRTGHAVVFVIRWVPMGTGTGIYPGRRVANEISKPKNMKRIAEACVELRYLWVRIRCGRCEFKDGNWRLALQPRRWYLLDFGGMQGVHLNDLPQREIGLAISKVRVEKCGLGLK